MDFELTQDQALLRDSVRRLVSRKYPFEPRRRLLGDPHGHSPAMWRLLARRGILGIGLPKGVGGYGGPTEIMLVMEEFGRALVLEPFNSTVVLCGGLIRGYGTVAQRMRLLRRIATGDCRLALAHHEAGARYVLDHIGTIARQGRGAYVLDGKKTLIVDAPVANLLIVSARDEAAGGLSLFLVEPTVPGVRVASYRTQDGRSAADITFNDVRVGRTARLGAPGVALTALEVAVDCALAALCAEAVGVIEAVNESTLLYLNTHAAFDRGPQRMEGLFLMAIQAKAMSCLATQSCQESDRTERRRALSATREFVDQAARFAAQQAVQLHGGPEMTAGLAISGYCQRLAQINAAFGDVDHHRSAFGDLLRVES